MTVEDRYKSWGTTKHSEEIESSTSGPFLLAGLMWVSWVLTSFLIMLNIILPTYGNGFIMFMFFVIAIIASFSMGDRKKNDPRG